MELRAAKVDGQGVIGGTPVGPPTAGEPRRLLAWERVRVRVKVRVRVRVRARVRARVRVLCALGSGLGSGLRLGLPSNSWKPRPNRVMVVPPSMLPPVTGAMCVMLYGCV